MHNLLPTAPYPPGQYDPLEWGPVEPTVGLGFAPLVAAAAAPVISEGTHLVTSGVSSVVSSVSNFIGGLFGGGGNKDEPDGWEEKAYAGWLPCPSGGTAEREPPNTMLQINDHTQWPGEWHKGMHLGPFDYSEVVAALDAAPPGKNGPAEFGTREGLIYALMQPNSLRRRPRDNHELANMAIYVADGRADCGVNWKEEPAVAHLTRIVDDFRSKQAAQSGGGLASPEWLEAGAGDVVQSVSAAAKSHPAEAVLVGAGLIVGLAMLLAPRH